ncbi:hypothetical protein PRIPAC_96877 [Pristionchus pacificus]|uniref:Uncharacterized protein n=1 Tax=Pristionchus pacificus TaxID=54126 RepID=A0A2A6BCR1_PRIPA|nr:hypothetical protein PRIPAC_96877 [Pristionchus pacificus]|eukprot:PDM63680.1 hypothetical protein PRIPAC_49653 [Pristionchus pacificus]
MNHSMILFFVLLPSLVHSAFLRDHHDCFLAKLRILCGNEDYNGPLIVDLWDDNLDVLGGDTHLEPVIFSSTEREDPSSFEM